MNYSLSEGELMVNQKPLILNNNIKPIFMKNLKVTKNATSEKMTVLTKNELLTIKGGGKAKVKTIDPK